MVKSFLDPTETEPRWPDGRQLDGLADVVDRASRRHRVQLPGEFAFAENKRTVLGQLVRSGDADLRLYLTLVLATAKADAQAEDNFREYWKPRPASWFARVLGYVPWNDYDPSSSGVRKVQQSMARLGELGLIRSEVDADGSHFFVNHLAQQTTPPYVSLDLDFWRSGWISVLPKRAIAVYVALRRHCAGKEAKPFMLTPRDRGRYGLSTETWRRGEADLTAAGLLTIELVRSDEPGIPVRTRRQYRLHSSVLGEELTADWAARRREALAAGA